MNTPTPVEVARDVVAAIARSEDDLKWWRGRAITLAVEVLDNARPKADPAAVEELGEFGPQTKAVEAILDLFPKRTKKQTTVMVDSRDDAFWAAWGVARGGQAARAGLGAARRALYDRLDGCSGGGGAAAYGAALAVLLRHTIGVDGFEQEHYDALTRPWVLAMKVKAHPDD